jgi:hypothetical protein
LALITQSRDLASTSTRSALVKDTPLLGVPTIHAFHLDIFLDEEEER